MFLVSRGQTEHGKVSDVVREVSLEVKSIFSCYETETIRGIISQRGLCVGGDGAGPCFGDSGGGFFTARGKHWYLRGITSSSAVDGQLKCDVNSHVVMTNIENFRFWIVRTMIVETERMKRGNKTFLSFSF